MTTQTTESAIHGHPTTTSATRVRAALFGDTGPAGETLASIYGAAGLSALRELTTLYPTIVTSANLESCLADLQDVEAIFATWGMLRLSEAHLDRLPRLRAVFYAAGSVQYFARPLLRRGITVVSGWAANAVPVAEYTLAQILLANKGYFSNLRDYQHADSHARAFRGQGNYGATVALLGAGQVGRKVIELLSPFHLKIVVFDPNLSQTEASGLGVELVSLDAAFARGNVVSNHLANVPGTRRLLQEALFETMPAHATFINTGRGATVDEADLCRVLQARPDLTALLDVTDPEPLPAASALWTLRNVRLSTHIAGAIGDEVRRVAEVIMDEFQAWQRGMPLRYAVTETMLKVMA